MRTSKGAVLLVALFAHGKAHSQDIVRRGDLPVICTKPDVKEGALVSDNVCKGYEQFNIPTVKSLVRSASSGDNPTWLWRMYGSLKAEDWINVCGTTLDVGIAIPTTGKNPCIQYNSLTRDIIEYQTPTGTAEVTLAWPASKVWTVSEFHTGEPLPPRVIYKVYGGPRGFPKHELTSVLNQTSVKINNQPLGEFCYEVTASAREFEPTPEEWAIENFEPANDFESPPSPENCHFNRAPAPTDGALE